MTDRFSHTVICHTFFKFDILHGLICLKSIRKFMHFTLMGCKLRFHDTLNKDVESDGENGAGL